MTTEPNLVRAALRVVVVLVAVLLPHLVPLPLHSYSLAILLMVWLFLRYEGVAFKDLGFSFSAFSWKAIPVGIIAAIGIVGFLQLVFFPLIEMVIDFPETQVDMYEEVAGNSGFYVMMLTLGWLIGGFYEEIVFHGFIFYQLKALIKGKQQTAISFLITGALFGLYHLQLGPADALNAFIAGGLYHLLALRFDGNLWYSIICHGTYNTIVITMLYQDYI